MATETSNFKFYLALLTILVTVITYNNLPSASAQTQNPRGSYLSVIRGWLSEPKLNSNKTQNQNENHHWNSGPRRDSKRQQCKINYKFDYIQLSLQWAPGVCSTSPKACKHIENKYFTIHGMWPTITGTHEPSDCCFDNTFEFEKLKPILGDLDQYWFSYYDKSSRGFWSHEWLKHGTCARDIVSLRGEQAYFGTTLQLTKQLPIYDDLAKAGIKPSQDNQEATYSSSQILAALKNLAQGHRIQINCDYEHSQPIPVLTGFNFCYNSELKLTDCPPPRSGRCQRQLLFRA